MDKYKLVPVEPTEEMLEAGHYAMVDGYHPGGVYRTMLAAAPAVQGEPVGWQFYQDGKWWYGDDRIKLHRKNTEAAGMPVRDVYAAPQPTEQPECGCCGQTDRCDDDCDAVVIGGHRTAEQQSAPVFHDEGHVSIPLGLITAACSAIDKKRDGTKTLAELRRYTFGDLSKQPAPEVAASPRVDRVPVYAAPITEQVERWRHDSEDLEALHNNLDDAGTPRHDSSGIEYSAWGRVIQYAKAAAKAEAAEQKSTACVGCEGAPASGNSPCAVCGQNK